MHVAGHGRVHLHQDGTRHVHEGGKTQGSQHVHKDGTAHDHKTGKHVHQDGRVHQHELKKPKMCMDQMACCPPEGMKKAGCCPSCGNAACTCCKMNKPQMAATEGAGTPPAGLSIQTLDLPLLSWLKKYL